MTAAGTAARWVKQLDFPLSAFRFFPLSPFPISQGYVPCIAPFLFPLSPFPFPLSYFPFPISKRLLRMHFRTKVCIEYYGAPSREGRPEQTPPPRPQPAATSSVDAKTARPAARRPSADARSAAASA